MTPQYGLSGGQSLSRVQLTLASPGPGIVVVVSEPVVEPSAPPLQVSTPPGVPVPQPGVPRLLSALSEELLEQPELKRGLR